MTSDPRHSPGEPETAGPPTRRILAAAAFVFALVMNGLANGLPLGGKTTGELSALYPNLVVPAGGTFSIWLAIYLLAGTWCVVQFLPAPGELGRRLAPAFALSSLLNGAWIFAWHYQAVPISLLIMLALLATLVVLNAKLRHPTEEGEAATDPTAAAATADPSPDPAPTPRTAAASGSLPTATTTPAATSLARAAFGIYLGWILVATIVNLTVLFVDLGWEGAPLTPTLWATLLAVAGAAIAILTLRQLRNPWIAASVIWALGGITVARLDEAPLVAWTAIAMLLVVALGTLHFVRTPGNGQGPTHPSGQPIPDTPRPT